LVTLKRRVFSRKIASKMLKDAQDDSTR